MDCRLLSLHCSPEQMETSSCLAYALVILMCAKTYLCPSIWHLQATCPPGRGPFMRPSELRQAVQEALKSAQHSVEGGLSLAFCDSLLSFIEKEGKTVERVQRSLRLAPVRRRQVDDVIEEERQFWESTAGKVCSITGRQLEVSQHPINADTVSDALLTAALGFLRFLWLQGAMHESKSNCAVSRLLNARGYWYLPGRGWGINQLPTLTKQLWALVMEWSSFELVFVKERSSSLMLRYTCALRK